MQMDLEMQANKLNRNRFSLNPQQHQSNGGLNLPRHSSMSAASVFSLADIEEHLYRNNNFYHNLNQMYLNESNTTMNSTPSRVSIANEPPPSMTIQMENLAPPQANLNRNRANSTLSLAKNRIRIMAMLDEVRKKRELRDRRRSDIMAYLDDLIVHDDPVAMATGAAKRYRRRFNIYQFLNHPCTGAPWSITYHVLVFIIVFVCLILTICATIQKSPLQEQAIRSVYLLEKIVITWFSIEFFVGLWSCSCKKRYRGFMGKVRYLTVPSRLIDLIVLSLTTVVLIFNPSKTGHEVFVVSAFRGFHRFFQVAQVLTLNRPLKPWKVLASVIYDQREQLFIILYTEFIVLCTLAYVAFLVERDSNPNFNSIADSMWWAIVTLSTVGYGDRVPVTWVGKIISTMFTILGVAIFALPAGIIGTGLALKIEEVERNQIRNRKKVAAAILIQRAWRCWKAHTTYELVSKFFRERPMPIYKQHDYLSMATKFIAFGQFYTALNKFRELMRPLDLKTVVQSYSDGQTEVLLRTKLVQQSIEELTRRIELSENRVANMSMRVETKQNTFERRIDHIRQLLESCHRQLLANHLLVELLRSNNTQLINNRKHGKISGKSRFHSATNASTSGASSGDSKGTGDSKASPTTDNKAAESENVERHREEDVRSGTVVNETDQNLDTVLSANISPNDDSGTVNSNHDSVRNSFKTSNSTTTKTEENFKNKLNDPFEMVMIPKIEVSTCEENEDNEDDHNSIHEEEEEEDIEPKIHHHKPNRSNESENSENMKDTVPKTRPSDTSKFKSKNVPKPKLNFGDNRVSDHLDEHEDDDDEEQSRTNWNMKLFAQSINRSRQYQTRSDRRMSL